MKDTSAAETPLAAGGTQTIRPSGLGTSGYLQFDVDGQVQVSVAIGNRAAKVLGTLTDERATYRLRGVREITYLEKSGSAAATVDFRGYVEA